MSSLSLPCRDLTCRQALLLGEAIADIEQVPSSRESLSLGASSSAVKRSASLGVSSIDGTVCPLENGSSTQQTRRVHFGLHFTPVNASQENSSSLSPRRSQPHHLTHSSSLTSQKNYPGKCRLIGFTPLNEGSDPQKPESTRFLGPRQVKAKEVAPCALFYKRSDVFVSSEMKSHNVLSFCNSHYENIRFDDESSGNEHEYTNPLLCQPCSLPSLKTLGEGLKLTDVPEASANFNPEPVDAGPETLGHLFAKDGLTAMPHCGESDSLFSFPSNPLDPMKLDNVDSAVVTYSGPEFSNSTWSAAGDDLNDNNPASSASSCGIHSGLWELATSTSTRATSPVSSLYSNISSSCHHTLLTSALLNHHDFESGFDPKKLNENKARLPRLHSLSSLRLASRKGLGGRYRGPKLSLIETNHLIHKYGGSGDIPEDRGTLADDEGDEDSLSSQPLGSEDEQESSDPSDCSDSPPLVAVTPTRSRKEGRAFSMPAHEKPKSIYL